MDIATSFHSLERHCRQENYAGFCKFDALNSPVLEAVFGFSPLSRLLVSQAVNRIPLPLRSLFHVRKLRNPKGIANFIRGYCALQDGEPGPENLRLIRELADWLIVHHSASYATYDGPGLAWGYAFPWQSP